MFYTNLNEVYTFSFDTKILRDKTIDDKFMYIPNAIME